MTWVNRLCGKLKSLLSCERGAVAPLVGVCIITVVGAVAVAVDIGRAQVAQSKLQASLDAAGLAAGAMVSQELTEEDLKPEAEKYLDVNFAGQTVEATITEFDLELSEDQHLVTLKAKASLPTTFMRIFGHTTMDVAARTEITREMTGLEVALVLDVTGSMEDPVGGTGPGASKQKIVALRESAVKLVEAVFGDNEEVDDLWIGVVPFSQTVNIGTDHADWITDLDSYLVQDNCVGPNNHANWNHTHVVGETEPDYCPTNGPNVSTRTKPHTLVDDYMFADDPTAPKVNGPGITPAAPALTTTWYFQPHTWGGCVLERWDNNRDVTDDPPATQKWATYFVPDTSGSGNNNWRTNTGGYNINADHDEDGTDEERSANKGCPEQAITTFTNKRSELTTGKSAVTADDGTIITPAVPGTTGAIDLLLYPRGNTHINVGAVWGWRLLSPKWRGVWGGDMDTNNLPLDYDEPLSQKVMILMTDGTNTMSGSIYTAFGWLADEHLGTDSSGAAVTALNNKTAAICADMKEEGILIYTIVFGNGSSTSAKNLMKNCASEVDYYFDSSSQTALDKAFSTIGDSLSKLRISH